MMLSSAAQRVFDPLLIERYLELFAPGVQSKPRRYRSRVMVETPQRGWRAQRGDPRHTIISALVAGADGSTTDITGCAIRSKRDDQTHVVRLDIDRGDAQAIVHELAGRFGESALLVTRSRRRGRFHILMRLVRPLSVELVHQRAEHLVRAVTQKGDWVEAFPKPNVGLRLPFGTYGCELADDVDDLSRTFRRHPWELLERARRLTPIELPEAAQPPPTRTARRRRARRRGGAPRYKRRTCTEADRLIRYGIDAGERDKGERTIIIALHARGVPRTQAISRMRRLILYDGLIDRTNHVRVTCHGDVERAREGRAADMARRVGHYYDKYAQELPRPARLSAYDVMAIEAHARERAVITGVPERDLRVFLYRVLQMFKAAALAGLPELQWHHLHWQDAASHSRYGYAVLRRAAGVFSTDGSYLRREHAQRPDDAHAMRWHVSWAFDRVVPRRPLHTGARPLTGSVAVAVGISRRKVAKGYRPGGLVRQPRRSAPTWKFDKPTPTNGDQTSFPSLIVGIATKPSRRRGFVASESGPVLTLPLPGAVGAVADLDTASLRSALAADLSDAEQDRILREIARRARAAMQGGSTPSARSP